ncbi:MAG: ATP-dependent RNA helicase HrpA [Planctomycetota bacterium]
MSPVPTEPGPGIDSGRRPEPPPALETLRAKIAGAMRADQPGLRRLAKKIRDAQRSGRPHDRNLNRLAQDLAASCERRDQRAAALPPITYPDDLPISQKRDEIARVIRDHQVVVVCGETGSGKSTQLPKILLEFGCGVGGTVAHTQPRRIAARTLATRVAQELGVPLGQSVGYAVRFNDTTGPLTHVRYLTDGLLLAELGRDPDLLNYDAIIIDEAHERSLNIDFLLGYLKRLLPRRPDLKLVITSATIDPQRFADYFGETRAGKLAPAPIVEVSGRTFPVETRYRPLDDDSDATAEGPALDRALCAALDEVAAATHGDVLVFMPTERAISQAAKTLRSHAPNAPHLARGKPLEILPLYARLSNVEQQKVFTPTGRTRRVVIATNVAESSVTVPNITAVIDPGTARISRYSPRTRMQRLPVEAVSQASANQRAGRCGRVAPGVCIRLCSEQQFADREAFTTPEVLRTSLAAVILRMTALGLGEIEDFPFIEPPKASMVREGLTTLAELGAIDKQKRLTKIGHQLAKLPIDPRVGRMVLAGADEGCLAEVLVIASALEGQDPRVRPAEHAQAADQAHAAFAHPASDFLSLLKLWDFCHAEKARLSNNQFRKACIKHFISYPRLREWFDLHRQLVDLSRAAGLKLSRRVTGEDALDKIGDPVHRALLAGLLSNLALKTDAHEYTGAHNSKLRLWPGSALSKQKNRPRWVVCAEVVVTSQQFARTCAQINPNWVESIAGPLVTNTHREPHWVRESGFVAAFEKVSLYGLTLIPKRRIRYGAVEPAKAREIFIHEALVEGNADIRAPFFEHNRSLKERLDKLQAKQRRFDLVADTQARYDFYDRRLPPEVCGVAELNRFRKQTEREKPNVLFMTEADLAAGGWEQDESRPDELAVGGMKLPLEYKYDAGADDDGVTLKVPLHALGRLNPGVVEWGVPGLLAERITALIRSLPKDVRKPLVPAPTSAAQAAEKITFGEGDFLTAVAEALGNLCGERLDPLLFDTGKLERHHQLNIAVVDEDGQVLGQGRDVPRLQDEYGAEAGRAAAGLSDPAWVRDGLTGWPDVGELPAEVEINHDGFKLLAYPTLIDQETAVGLRTVETPERATQLHVQGVLRLCAIASADRTGHAIETWPERDRLLLLYSPLGEAARLKHQLIDRVAQQVFGDKVRAYPPRSAEAFEALLGAGRGDVEPAADALCGVVLNILNLAQPLRLELEGISAECPPGWDLAVGQLAAQLAELVSAGFVERTPEAWLPHVPRYLNAARVRLRKLREGKADRDRQNAAVLEGRWGPYRQAAEVVPDHPELTAYRWMLEEWRVSLFAQELGTSIPVSEKRLDRQWKKVQRAL